MLSKQEIFINMKFVHVYIPVIYCLVTNYLGSGVRKNSFFMLMDSVEQEFRQVTVMISCLFSIIFGTSAGKNRMGVT